METTRKIDLKRHQETKRTIWRLCSEAGIEMLRTLEMKEWDYILKSIHKIKIARILKRGADDAHGFGDVIPSDSKLRKRHSIRLMKWIEEMSKTSVLTRTKRKRSGEIQILNNLHTDGNWNHESKSAYHQDCW